MQNGYGIETWSDGSRYEGYYLGGKKHGKGEFYFYAMRELHSFLGTYLWSDGSKFIGDWKDNKINGNVTKINKLNLHIIYYREYILG